MPYFLSGGRGRKNGLTYLSNKYLLDQITGASVAYSLRKMKSTATRSVRVRRSLDNAEIDVGFSGLNLDTSTLLSHCGTYSGFISAWYDQSGNGSKATQGTAGYQPKIVNAGSYLSGILYDGADSLLDAGTIFNNVANMSMSAYLKPLSHGETYGRVFDKGKKQLFTNLDDQFEFYQEYTNGGYWNATSTYSTSTYTNLVVTYTMTTSSNPSFYKDAGTLSIFRNTTPSGATVSDASDRLTIGNRTARDKTFDGYINELVLFPRIITLAEITRMNI